MEPDAARQPEIASAALAHLRRSDAFRALDPASRADLDEAMAKVQGYLAPDQPYARQLAPDLRAALAPRGQTAPQRPGAQPVPAAPPAPAAAPQPSVTGRVGDVARATLNAIDFPSFVASLIQGTFQAIVDASIQQMEAYAELLRNVAGTVDRFMRDNIDEGTAKDYLADTYPNTFRRDTGQGAPQLVVNRQSQNGDAVPSFLEDLGFSSSDDIDSASVDEVIVPATRRTLAEQRQQTLATMVLMGINRIVVDDGEIQAKLIFHIDASETTELKFDNRKTSKGNMSGTAGRNPFSANGVMVNTTSLNAQSDINVRADLTGQVTVRFRSEVFPLERFADSAAVQFINSNARVPAAPGEPVSPAPAAAPPVAAPATPATPAPPAATQAVADDAWAPKQAGA